MNREQIKEKTIGLLNTIAIGSSAKSGYSIEDIRYSNINEEITFNIEDENDNTLEFVINLGDKSFIHTELYRTDGMGYWNVEELIVIATSLKEKIDDVMWNEMIKENNE